jgi:hypothetical protein
MARREQAGVCRDCGAATSRTDVYRCRPCHFEAARVEQAARRAQVPALVAEGLTCHQIAARVGCGYEAIRQDVRALGLRCPIGEAEGARRRATISEADLNRRALVADAARGWPPGAVARCRSTGLFFGGRDASGALIVLARAGSC